MEPNHQCRQYGQGYVILVSIEPNNWQIDGGCCGGDEAKLRIIKAYQNKNKFKNKQEIVCCKKE